MGAFIFRTVSEASVGAIAWSVKEVFRNVFHLDKNPRRCNTAKGPDLSSASSGPPRGKLVLTEFYTERTNGGPVLQPSMKRTVRVARMHRVKKGGSGGSGGPGHAASESGEPVIGRPANRVTYTEREDDRDHQSSSDSSCISQSIHTYWYLSTFFLIPLLFYYIDHIYLF